MQHEADILILPESRLATRPEAARAVARALRTIPGVSQVRLDLRGGTLEIVHDPARASAALLKARVRDGGFLGGRPPAHPGVPAWMIRRLPGLPRQAAKVATGLSKLL